jgi:hypothetical protein
VAPAQIPQYSYAEKEVKKSEINMSGLRSPVRAQQFMAQTKPYQAATSPQRIPEDSPK